MASQIGDQIRAYLDGATKVVTGAVVTVYSPQSGVPTLFQGVNGITNQALKDTIEKDSKSSDSHVAQNQNPTQGPAIPDKDNAAYREALKLVGAKG